MASNVSRRILRAACGAAGMFVGALARSMVMFGWASALHAPLGETAGYAAIVLSVADMALAPMFGLVGGLLARSGRMLRVLSILFGLLSMLVLGLFGVVIAGG